MKKNMSYYQTDDIPSCEPKKDCIHTHYRIMVDGQIVKEGRYALKQTTSISNRIIYKRRWNESKREWKDAEWTTNTNL